MCGILCGWWDSNSGSRAGVAALYGASHLPASGITHLRVSSCLQSFHEKCFENLVCWFRPGNLSTREVEAVQCYPQLHTEASLDYIEKKEKHSRHVVLGSRGMRDTW